MDDNTDGADITVSMLKGEQALVYFPGDGMALFLTDQLERADLREYLPSTVARSVLATRLRAFADMLEPNPLDDYAVTVQEATR